MKQKTAQIFSIQEFRELFITLLKEFDQGKMSKYVLFFFIYLRALSKIV